MFNLLINIVKISYYILYLLHYHVAQFLAGQNIDGFTLLRNLMRKILTDSILGYGLAILLDSIEREILMDC